jgi:hypothetical protein
MEIPEVRSWNAPVSTPERGMTSGHWRLVRGFSSSRDLSSQKLFPTRILIS